MSRRICWPDPDATCLEGGCTHCNDAEFVSETKIRSYARTTGEVPNRYGGKAKSAWAAYWYGYDRETYEKRWGS